MGKGRGYVAICIPVYIITSLINPRAVFTSQSNWSRCDLDDLDLIWCSERQRKSWSLIAKFISNEFHSVGPNEHLRILNRVGYFAYGINKIDHLNHFDRKSKWFMIPMNFSLHRSQLVRRSIRICETSSYKFRVWKVRKRFCRIFVSICPSWYMVDV